MDEGEGSELRGRRIELGTRSRDVTASGNVRHTLGRKGRDGSPRPSRRRGADRAGVPGVRVRLPRRVRRGIGRTPSCGRERTRSAPPPSSSRTPGRGAAGSWRAGEPPRSSTRGGEGRGPGAGGGGGAQPGDGLRGVGEPDRLHRRRRDPAGGHPDPQPGGGGDPHPGRRGGRPDDGRRAGGGATRARGAPPGSAAPTPRPTRPSSWWGRRWCCRTWTAGSRAAS